MQQFHTLFRGSDKRRPAAVRRTRARLRLEALEDRYAPAVVNWTGNGDGVAWSDARNWDNGGALPDNTSDVRIAVTSQIVQTGETEIKSLVSSANLVVTGTLTMDQSSISTGAFDVNLSGTSIITGAGSVLDLLGGGRINGTMISRLGATTLFESSTYILNGPQYLSDGAGNVQQLPNPFGVGLIGPGAFQINGGTFNVAGPVNAENLAINGGTVTSSDYGTLTVAASGTWAAGDFTGNGTLVIPAGVSFNIEGGITGPSNKNLSWGLDNQGSITLQGQGNLIASSTIITNEVGAMFAIQTNASIFGSDSEFQNAGTLQESDGDSTIGISLENTGNLAVKQDANLDLVGGGVSSGGMDVASGAQLRITNSQFAGDGVGAFALDDGAVITGTGVFAIGSASAPPLPVGTFNLFVNGELITARPTVKLYGVVGGTGTLDVATEMDWISGALGDAATTVIDSSALLDITGGATKFLSATHHLINEGTTWWDGGNIRMQMGTAFDNRGAFEVYATDVVISAPTVADIPGTFHNEGTFTKMASTGLTLMGVTFDSSGSVYVNGGRLKLTQQGEASGTFTAAAGSTVEWALSPVDPTIPAIVTYTLDANGPRAPLTGDGTYVLSKGYLDIPDDTFVTATNFVLTADGNIMGAGTFEAHSFLWQNTATSMMVGIPDNTAPPATVIPCGATLVGAGDQMTIKGAGQIRGRTLDVRGEVDWYGSDLTLAESAVVDIKGGTFKAEAPGILKLDTNAPNANQVKIEVDPNGQFQVDDDLGGTVIVGMPIDNEGGGVTLQDNTNLDGGINQNSGTVQVDSGVTVTSLTPMAVTGGVVNVAGTMNFPNLIPDGILLVNRAGVIHMDGGTLTVTANMQMHVDPGGRLSGAGTVSARLYNEGLISVTSGTLELVTPDSNPIYQEAGRTVVDHATLLVDTGYDQVYASSLELVAGTIQGTEVLIEKGTFSADGTVSADLRILDAATLYIGAQGVIGTLEVTGTFTTSGSLYMKATADTIYDHLILDGTILLGGLIHFDTALYYAPATGTPFDVIRLNANYDYGSFSQVEWGNQNGTNLISYDTDKVRLTAP
jgi:hypothetical protein